MERLTIRNSDGSVSQPTDLKWAEALERLADFEDIGFEPSELSEMRIALEDAETLLDNKANYNTPKTRKEILNTAMKCVCEGREQDYGKPENSFAMIASLWEPYIKNKCLWEDGVVTIMPEDVAAMMCLFKIARVATGHGKADNWVDCAGYAAVGGELESGANK